MKHLQIVLFLLCCTYFAFGQKVGLRGGIEWSNKKQVSNVLGGGVFIAFDNFSEKFELVAAFDYFNKERQFESQNLITEYSKYQISIASLFVKTINGDISFKIGPSVNYNIIESTHQGSFSNWIAGYDARSIGIGLAGAVGFNRVFNSPFCIDLFVSPTYLMNLSNSAEDGGLHKFSYGEDYLNVTFQLGVSYEFGGK